MAEAGLTQGYPDIAKALGRFLGYGGVSGNWSVDQADEISTYIQSGLRQFYFPPPLPGQAKSHEWRFMRPSTTLATVVGQADYTMPDNFGALHGDLTYVSSSAGYVPIKVVGEGDIFKRRQGYSITGFPLYAAIRPNSSDGTTGLRYTMMLWPTPNAIFTLNYQFTMLKDQISAAVPYPLGGMQHAETLLESCLAIAEQRADDESGIHTAKFMQMLAASVSIDKSQDRRHFGKNLDRSDKRDVDGYSRTIAVTYNGVAYS